MNYCTDKYGNKISRLGFGCMRFKQTMGKINIKILCVLSGMNSLEMVLDNVNTVSSTNPGDLDSEDQAMLHRVADAINSKMKVKCTGCGKCIRHCPQGIDIPMELKRVQKEFENPIYKIAKKLFHKLM